MAPKRKPTNADDAAPASATAAAAVKYTRRSARLASVAVAPPAVAPEHPKKKKAKTTNKREGKAQPPPSPAVKVAVTEPEIVKIPKNIIVEHCRQCNSFKTRAIQVKDGLEKSVEGVNVVVNPEKPRRGWFEIREEDGEVFVSLQDMERPFPPLKALNMEKLISEIIEKIR